jgi:hypothetical protein
MPDAPIPAELLSAIIALAVEAEFKDSKAKTKALSEIARLAYDEIARRVMADAAAP